MVDEVLPVTEKPKPKKVPYRMIGLHPKLFKDLLEIREKNSKEFGFHLSWSDFFRRFIFQNKGKAKK